VRDVVSAYAAVFYGAPVGSVFNVCSGRGMRLAEAIQQLSNISGVAVHTELDQSLVRPVENTVVVGSHQAITSALGWRPVISFEQSLKDLLEYWIDILRS